MMQTRAIGEVRLPARPKNRRREALKAAFAASEIVVDRLLPSLYV